MFPRAIFVKFRKPFLTTEIKKINFILTPGGSPPVVLFHLGLCGMVFPATSSPGPAGVWPAIGARSTATHAWSPNPSPSPNSVFLHLHVDIVGPLQYSNNFNYIFTIIDRMSKWMETIPHSETSGVACTKAITFTWISRFGVPETITSDHGLQFTSSLWLQFCEMLNISHKQTTAYHPDSNGTVKRLHRRLKNALCTRTAAATWSEELPFVLLGLRAQPREDTGLTPA
jgi:hypothetical protein